MKATRPTSYHWKEAEASKNQSWLDRGLRYGAFLCGVLALIVASIPTLQHDGKNKGTAKTEQVSEQAQDPALESNSIPEAKVLANPFATTLNRISENQIHPYTAAFDREEILSDPKRRISDEFLIPPGLQARVGFWFDIYSRYDSNKRVIHHVLYPWVIYKVVDVEPIVNGTYPRVRWLRNEAAEKVVQNEMVKVRKALKSIASKRRKSQLEDGRLNPDEILVRDALLQLGGDVRRQAAKAVSRVRVQTGQRNYFAEGLQTAPRYMAVMEDIFESNGLPTELTRLPLVESSFNKHATSKVGAAGIWQFMEGTGKKKRLVVNDLVDERKSPFKATEAAAKLLKENHMILGRSWELAVTAWNHGPGGVKKASRAAGTRDLSRIIEIYDSKRFSFASENFFSEFLAALYTEKYSDRIFPGLPKQDPLKVKEVMITRKVKIKDILIAASITMDDFVQINPDLAKLIKLNQKLNRPLYKGLRIHVPQEAKSAIEYLLASEKERSRLIGANG